MQNSFGDLKILPGIGDFSGRHEVMKLKFREFRDFGECLPKIRDDIPDFWKNFYLHMVLLKQYL